jgi:hypothetical protein
VLTQGCEGADLRLLQRHRLTGHIALHAWHPARVGNGFTFGAAQQPGGGKGNFAVCYLYNSCLRTYGKSKQHF